MPWASSIIHQDLPTSDPLVHSVPTATVLNREEQSTSRKLLNTLDDLAGKLVSTRPRLACSLSNLNQALRDSLNAGMDPQTGDNGGAPEIKVKSEIELNSLAYNSLFRARIARWALDHSTDSSAKTNAQSNSKTNAQSNEIASKSDTVSEHDIVIIGRKSDSKCSRRLKKSIAELLNNCPAGARYNATAVAVRRITVEHIEQGLPSGLLNQNGVMVLADGKPGQVFAEYEGRWFTDQHLDYLEASEGKKRDKSFRFPALELLDGQTAIGNAGAIYHDESRPREHFALDATMPGFGNGVAESINDFRYNPFDLSDPRNDSGGINCEFVCALVRGSPRVFWAYTTTIKKGSWLLANYGAEFWKDKVSDSVLFAAEKCLPPHQRRRLSPIVADNVYLPDQPHESAGRASHQHSTQTANANAQDPDTAIIVAPRTQRPKISRNPKRQADAVASHLQMPKNSTIPNASAGVATPPPKRLRKSPDGMLRTTF